MRYFISQNFEHFLCVALLIAKLGDNISTRLVSPTLKLEANPIARKLGWGFAWFTLILCLVPYVSTAAAVALITTVLLVAASNFGKVWLARTLGEEETQRLMLSIVRRSRLSSALWPLAASMVFMAGVGGLLLMFYPDPHTDWGFWIGTGVILYACLMSFYGTVAFRGLFRLAQAEPS
jgi:hypothetical protein